MNKKELVLLILLSVILISLLGVAVGLVIISPQESITRTSIELIDKENSEYIIYNVPSDYELKIALNSGTTFEKGDFTVKDIEGNEIKTIISANGNDIIISAPKGGYISGEMYSIDLKDKGSFKEENLFNAQKLIFCVERNEASTIIYQDEVKEVSGKKVELLEDEIIIKGRYKDGDIIITDTNDDSIDEVYKLKKYVMERHVQNWMYLLQTKFIKKEIYFIMDMSI